MCERYMRDTCIGCLSHAPKWGTWPATQAHALTRIEWVTFQLVNEWHSLHSATIGRAILLILKH